MTIRLFRDLLVGVSACCLPSIATAQAVSLPPIEGVQNTARNALPSKAPGTGLLSSIFGCSAHGSKQKIGAAAGGVVGGVLGNRIAGSGNRTVGTVVGATIGAAAGSALGCKLQRSDQERAEAALAQTAESGQIQSWANPATGTSGSTRVASTQTSGMLGLRLANGIEPLDQYRRVDGYFSSTGRANIRTSPGMDGPIVGQMVVGERVWVPASSTPGDWLLVTRDGVGQGYVSSSLLMPEKAASIGCKIVQQTITVGGETETQNLRACREPTGGWGFSPITS